MTKAYVVTSGEYYSSDYRISAIFSTQEKAKEYVGDAPEGEYQIEEYEVDIAAPLVWKRKYVIELSGDGSTKEWDRVEYVGGQRGSGWTGHGKSKSCWWFQGWSFRSKVHARQLATRRRDKFFSEHQDLPQ